MAGRFSYGVGVALFVCLAVLLAGPAMAVLPAFPGAVGEGMNTTGGRGGEVYHVTNLSDSGTGSLRYGMNSGSGSIPRTIVFDVAGTITLGSGLGISRGNLTIAGQTAPGSGIVIRNHGTMINNNNVIVRHIRARPGDAVKRTQYAAGFDGDSLSLWGSDIIADHCSASWGIDENLSCAANAFKRVTVSKCIVAEALDQTGLYHGVYDSNFLPGGTSHHSNGSLFKPTGTTGSSTMTVYANLYSNNYNRNVAVGTYSINQTFKVDVVNNVMYNDNKNGYSSGETGRLDMNYIGNYIIAGPETYVDWQNRAFNAYAANRMYIYQSGNKLDWDLDVVRDGEDTGWSMITGPYTQVSTPVSLLPVTVMTADTAYDDVLDDAGAFPWARDSVDQRQIDNVRDGTGIVIDSQNEVGGYPTITAAVRPAGFDTDNDGMPNYWETWYGTNPISGDNNTIGAYGYTNLERYLQWILDRGSVYHLGDINGDNAINVGELGILAGHWGQAGTYDDGDLNHDGMINVGDLGVLAANWGWTWTGGPLVAPTSVPEPASLVLLAIGSMAMLRRRNWGRRN